MAITVEHIHRNRVICRACGDFCESGTCYVKVTEVSAYRVRYRFYCIPCAVRDDVAPGTTRCADR